MSSARPLGYVTTEMLHNGIAPKDDKSFRLQRPEQWSAEIKNLLDIASWSTLDQLKDVSLSR